MFSVGWPLRGCQFGGCYGVLELTGHGCGWVGGPSSSLDRKIHSQEQMILVESGIPGWFLVGFVLLQQNSCDGLFS